MTLDELVGRVVMDDYDRFAKYIKKYVPADIKFGEDDDVTAAISRYITFTDALGFSGEVKLKGLQDIFLAGVKAE